MRRRTRTFHIALFVALVWWPNLFAWASAMTDVVVLHNGDRLTGEIKKLDRGRLQLKTDDMGTVNVEWDKIVRLSSRDVFEVELESGQKYIGSIVRSSGERMLGIVSSGRETILEMDSVVRITPLKGSLKEGIRGFLDVGFIFARANRATQWTFGAEAEYRTSKHLSAVEGDSFFIDQDSVESTTENSVGLQHDRFPGRRWIISAKTGFQQNEELDLESRYSMSLSAGRFIIQTSSTLLSLTAGINTTRVARYSSTDTKKSQEAVVELEFSVARYHDPEMDLSTEFTAYPSISPRDRIRLEFSLRWKYELVNDLFLVLELNDDYDSKAGIDGAAINDWDIDTSLGWSF